MSSQKTTEPASAGPAKKAESGDDDDTVDLIVGGYSYTTPRTVLLSSPFHSYDDGHESYFHSLLSGQKKRTKISGPIEIQGGVSGRLFLYVLLFLQLGELPRGLDAKPHDCLLPKEDIDKLESQAEFFGLPRLVKLCKAAKNVLKGVRGAGDLDLTPFSEFSVKISEHFHGRSRYRDYSQTIRYNYKNDTTVQIDLEEMRVMSRMQREANMWILSNGEKTKQIVEFVDGEFYCADEADPDCDGHAVFKDILKIVRDEHANKKSNDENVSVTSILDQIEGIVTPEARLWFAFLIGDVIDCIAKKGQVLNDVDPLEFMMRDGSIFMSMKTVS